jgi:hypothetical protein
VPSATSYPLLDAFWTILIFFAFVVWLWVLFLVVADIVGRVDLSGWAKVGWITVVALLPYVGVLVYVVAHHEGMAERGPSLPWRRDADRQPQRYVRPVSTRGDPERQIAEARALLAGGLISESEFEQIERNATAM